MGLKGKQKRGWGGGGFELWRPKKGDVVGGFMAKKWRGRGFGTGATHGEGGARRSRNPSTAGTLLCGRRACGVEQGREALRSGPSRRLGPTRRDREEKGREGDRWAQFSNLVQIQ
jgi:hypothetical protein